MHRLVALAFLGLLACTPDTEDKVSETDVGDTDFIVDGDNDGSPSNVDCDDADPNNFPGNTEICDGADNDCDTLVDNDDDSLDGSSAATYYADSDHDGFGAAELGTFCTPPMNSATVDGDCDDNNSDAFPGNPEICDGFDNDCDDLVDDDDTIDPSAVRVWYVDADSDGFGDEATSFEACDGGDAVGISGDCDDGDASINPGMAEVCDGGVDNNCNNLADDDDPVLDMSSATTWWIDNDGDTFGLDGTSFTACVAVGAATRPGDCNDTILGGSINPDATEIPANGIDEDCDTNETCYADGDGDGYGTSLAALSADFTCTSLGVAPNSGDCNDANDAINPGATEVCNGGIDDDCINGADDNDANVDLTGEPTVYLDPDGDGYGTPGTGFQACVTGGLPTIADDCAPNDFAINPGANEVCDGIDNDCDDDVDVDDANFDASTGTDRYVDNDGDNYGTGPLVTVCLGDAGYADVDGDCNDNNADINPGATEVCNGGIDDDCDGAADLADADVDLGSALTFYTDLDGDGYGIDGTGTLACEQPPLSAPEDGDCNDLNSDVNPGATEVCDGIDNDCVNGADDIDAWADTSLPYRLPITVSAPDDWNVDGVPVSIDIDFAAALAALGDTSGLNPNTIRVANQDCALGQPELPSQWVDSLNSVFDKAPFFDPTGDEYGALSFLYDEDGDYASRERLNQGTSGEFAVYFGSNATSPGAVAPSYSTTLVATTDGTTAELSNAYVEATFDVSTGGITDYLASTGRPSTGAQTTTLLGNGIFMGDPAGGAGSWVSARNADSSSLLVTHAGPVLSVIRSKGTASNAYGAYEFVYFFYLFEGRPEIYVKTRFTLTEASTVGPQSPFWGAAVRPFVVNNGALASAAASQGGADIPGFNWARAGYATGGTNAYGIAVGYRETVALRSRPVYTPTTDPDAGKFVGLAGQDFTPTFVSGQTVLNGNAGNVLLNWPIIAVYPHEGLFGAVSVDFFGTLDGATTAVGTAEGI